MSFLGFFGLVVLLVFLGGLTVVGMLVVGVAPVSLVADDGAVTDSVVPAAAAAAAGLVALLECPSEESMEGTCGTVVVACCWCFVTN